MKRKMRMMSLLLVIVMVVSIVRINSIDSYAYGAISNLKVDANGIATWDPYPGADYYYVSCGGTMDGDYRGECKIDLKEWLKSNESGTYTLEVGACSDTVEGGWLTDPYAPATVDYDFVSTAIKLATPTGVKWDGLKATWNKVDGAANYIIDVYDYNNGDPQHLFLHDTYSSATSRDCSSDVRFKKGKKYCFKVVARNEDGYIDSEYSEMSGPVDGWFAIGDITGLKVNSNGYVSWNAYSGADGYEIFYTETDYVTIKNTTTGVDFRSYLIATGCASGTYTFKIQAFKNVNDNTGIYDAYISNKASVTYNFVNPNAGSSGGGSGSGGSGSSSGGSGSGSSGSGAGNGTGSGSGSANINIDDFSYSNEWVNGVWYNADGTQTYNPTGSWKYNGVGWWYEDSSGWYPAGTWQKIDKKWYYFTSSGYMDYGEYRDGCWLNDDGSWNENYSHGKWYQNSTGWWYEDDGWYPVNTYLWIDGYKYWFNSDGYWG